MKKAFVLPATALEKDSVMPWIALTPATIRAGMAVHPSNARTLLPERFMGFTAKRFIHNERGQHCTVLADGSHEVSCVVTDTLWTNDSVAHGYAPSRAAYKTAVQRLPGKCSASDIFWVIGLAREALRGAYDYKHTSGPVIRMTSRHSLDTYGCGWWSQIAYRRVMLARFIVERRGVRVA